MKKSAWIGMLALTTALVSACGGGTEGGETKEPEQASNETPATDAATSGETKTETPAEKTKLTYWTGDRHDQEYIKEVIQKYNETNADNIEVELVVKTEEYDQALEIAFVSAQGPDVFRVKENTIQTYYKKGFMEPLDAYLTDDLKAKFPRIDSFNTFEGKVYSLPNYGSTMRLVYNVDLFEKAGIANPPKTLQEMVDAAKKITEVGKAEGAYGFALNFKNPSSALGRSARVIAEMSGTGGFGYDFKTGKFDFAGYKDIIQAFKQMKDDGSMLPGVESLDIDPLRAQFAEGKIGMYLSFSSEPGVYKNQFPAKSRWAATLAPTVDGVMDGASGFLGGQWLVMNKDSKNKEAAWKFMQYMYGDEVLTKYQEGGFGISMVPSIAEKAAKPDIAGIEGFLPTQYDAVWPLHPTVTVEGQNYNDVFFEYILQGGDLDAIIADLNDLYNAALDKAKANGEVVAEPMPDFDPAKMQGSFGG
jgi:multiple sugar transport system substrate-binding protein